MTERGRPSLTAKIGRERLAQLLATMSIEQVSGIICTHTNNISEKEKCKACRRALYRAKTQLSRKVRTEQTLQPIDNFAEIPEIKNLIQYQTAKGVEHLRHIQTLFRHWSWIRESELKESQRPAMWDERHVQFILNKLAELQVETYSHIQSLRRLFESMGKVEMLKHPLLRAKVKLMRSPKGVSRQHDRFTIEEYKQIRTMVTEKERTYIDLHVTLKCREGKEEENSSLLGLKWGDIIWQDTYYGFPCQTISVFEKKTGGGTRWQHCPINFWFADLSVRLAKLKLARQAQDQDRIVQLTYNQYRDIWLTISQKLGKKLEAHDCRRSPSGWLRDLGLDSLAIGQYDAKSGTAMGFAGVGWENPKVFYDRYGKMNPLAIFDKQQRLDTSLFDGLIIKILENR